MYNKLVRDKIPEIILNNGEKPYTRILSSEEYNIELKKKLIEEALEMQDSQNAEMLLEELADVIEVVKALAKFNNKTLEDILKIADTKNTKKGSFDKRIFLEKVE